MINTWVSGILGLVVAAVPFLTLSETALTWTLVIIGAVIAVSSFWSMLVSTDSRTHGVGSHV